LSLQIFSNYNKLVRILDTFCREVHHNLCSAITIKGERDGNNCEYFCTKSVMLFSNVSVISFSLIGNKQLMIFNKDLYFNNNDHLLLLEKDLNVQ